MTTLLPFVIRDTMEQKRVAIADLKELDTLQKLPIKNWLAKNVTIIYSVFYYKTESLINIDEAFCF